MLDAIEKETGPAPRHAVIWLHGLGADGGDFAPVVPVLGLSQSVRFVFPHAPIQPVTVNGGMAMPAWYDIYEMSLERKIDEAGIATSIAEVEALIEREAARGIPRSQVFVIGFSQGGAVALGLLEQSAEPLAGVVALSTYSPTLDKPVEAALCTQVPLAIHHGTEDPVVPESLGRRSHARMQALGFQPSYQTWPMAHSVLPEQLRAIGAWLNAQMG